MFYKAKIDGRGRYERTPKIREKCRTSRLKISSKVSVVMKKYWSKLSAKQKRKRLEKAHNSLLGKTPWNKGNRSKEYYEAELARNNNKYAKFRKDCFERDGYSCCLTGKTGGKLVVHHIYSFSYYPNLRYLTDNGITMTEKIHNEFHKIYGKRRNNLDQLLSFMEVKGVLQG